MYGGSGYIYVYAQKVSAVVVAAAANLLICCMMIWEYDACGINRPF